MSLSVRFKISDLMVLVVFVALGASGFRYDETIGFFEFVAFALAILCAGVVHLTRHASRFRPWLALGFFWCLWPPLCLAFAMVDFLGGPRLPGGFLLLAIGTAGSALSAFTAARFAPGDG